jgi:hypothetical protein
MHICIYVYMGTTTDFSTRPAASLIQVYWFLTGDVLNVRALQGGIAAKF